MTTNPVLSQMPGHLIRRLHQQATAVFQTQLKQSGHDITSVQYSALETLDRSPGLDQAGLAARIAYDRATIGGVVKRLEQKQLIQRTSNKDDRRAFVLRLTRQGKTVLEDIRPRVATLQDEILGNLTESDKALIVALMQKALQLDADTS